MRLHVATTPLSWPDLSLPMQPIRADWSGNPQDPCPSYAQAIDPKALWLVVQHKAPAYLHPTAQAGDFIESLWEYDVAEWFITAAGGKKYLEFNLGPQGAWWCCGFDDIRVRSHPAVGQPSGVRTYAKTSATGAWMAALVIPRAFLKDTLAFSSENRMNATMILGAPDQHFFTATDLGGGEPDYHRPDSFQSPEWIPLTR